MSLFETDRNSGRYFAAVKAPCETIHDALDHTLLYATAEGHDPDEAIMAARDKLFGGL